jgi:hypothetical protein
VQQAGWPYPVSLTRICAAALVAAQYASGKNGPGSKRYAVAFPVSVVI